MAGDAETGMMVMKMEKGLDTGPVALTAKVAISENMTAGELHDSLMLTGARLMRQAMDKLESSDLPLVTQAEEGVLYAAKIDKGETRIDFSRPAQDVHNHIRGLSPFPGAWLEMEIGGKAERVKVLASELASGMGKRARRSMTPLPLPAAAAPCGSPVCKRRAASRCRRPISCAAHRFRPQRGSADATFPHDRRI